MGDELRRKKLWEVNEGGKNGRKSKEGSVGHYLEVFEDLFTFKYLHRLVKSMLMG